MTDLRDEWHRAEAQLVGAALALYDERRVDDLLAQVSPDMFDRGAHRKTWEAIAKVREAGDTVDLASVTDELDRTGHLASVGGPLWLVELSAAVPTTSHAHRDAAAVVEFARRRDLHRTGQHLANLAHDRTIDCDTLVGDAVEALMAEAGRTGDGVIRVDQVSDAVLDRREHGIQTRGVSSGWPDLDQLYRIVPGKLTILAGLPGHGKSTWLDSLLVNLADAHRWRTILFSPESAPVEEHVDELVTRRVGRRADLGKVSGALGWVHEHFAWIDHDSHDNVSQILTAVRAEHARRPLNTFVIDPWTEVEVTRDRGEREDQYIRREVTRIRQFARRYDLHAFLVVHPKNMEPNRDGTYPVPRSHDLHGGSVWRKQADALIAVWRDEAGVTRDPNLTDIVVQKIRKQPYDGSLGRRTLRFDVSDNRYVQTTRLEYAA